MGAILGEPALERDLSTDTATELPPVSEPEAAHADVGVVRRLGARLVDVPTFNALRYSNFRLILLGQTCTSMGMWMDQVASGWLLYDLTRSPLQLGLLQGLQALPI